MGPRGRRCDSSRSRRDRVHSIGSRPIALFRHALKPRLPLDKAFLPGVSRLGAPKIVEARGVALQAKSGALADSPSNACSVTALIAWIGYDSRTASSLNLASDSRISFGSGRWDYGRKIFALQNRPEIFGYCGEVLFPSQVLGQLSSMLERDLLASSSVIDERTSAIRDFLALSVARYPTSAARPFSIIYAVRKGLGTQALFSLYQFDCSRQRQITLRELPLPNPGEIYTLGSGASSVNTWFHAWSQSDVRATSRSSFCALADAIRSRQDPNTGGAPQLASILNGLPHPRETGIVWQGERFLNGARVPPSEALRTIWWRNELFEVCDGFTGLRKTDAQRQPRPTQVPEPGP